MVEESSQRFTLIPFFGKLHGPNFGVSEKKKMEKRREEATLSSIKMSCICYFQIVFFVINNSFF